MSRTAARWTIEADGIEEKGGGLKKYLLVGYRVISISAKTAPNTS